MSPSKSKSKSSSGKVVLTGRSGTLTFGLPESDETLTLERGVPTEVPSAFTEQVEATEDVYPEGAVPEDAIVGPPAAEPPPLDEPADEAPPESPPSPAGTAPEPGTAANATGTPSQTGEPT